MLFILGEYSTLHPFGWHFYYYCVYFHTYSSGAVWDAVSCSRTLECVDWWSQGSNHRLYNKRQTFSTNWAVKFLQISFSAMSSFSVSFFRCIVGQQYTFTARSRIKLFLKSWYWLFFAVWPHLILRNCFKLLCHLELGHTQTSLYGTRAKRTLIELEGAIGQWGDITAFQDSLQPHPLGDRTPVFPLMQHLICMPGLAHIPGLISRQYFSRNISIWCRGKILSLFRDCLERLRMFMRVGTGDKETDRCCLLMVDLSWWQYRTIFGTSAHYHTWKCFMFRLQRGKK